MSKERLWTADYIKVMAANFALFFAFYLLTPLLPLYLTDHFGATNDVTGVVLSGYTVCALVARPLSGYLVDTFPRRRVLMWCFGLFAIFFFGYAAAGSLLLFALVRTLHGAPFGALTVANSTVAIDVLPSSRRREGIGYYGLSNNLAMALAPTIGLLLYRQTHSFQLLFWLALTVAAAGWGVDSTVKVPHRQPLEVRPRLSLDRFFLLRGWLIGANMVFFGFCFGVLSNYLAIYVRATPTLGGVGSYFLLCSLGLMLSRLQGSKALRQGRLVHNAAGGMLVSLAGYALFLLAPMLPSLAPRLALPLVAYYASALLIGLGNGHMWPAFQNMMIAVATSRERGTANSTILVAWDVGMGLGVLLGGVVSELWGYVSAFLAVALVNALGVALFFLRTSAFFSRRRLD